MSRATAIPAAIALVLAAAMPGGCDAQRGYARVAALDVCTMLDTARVAKLVGKPVRLQSQPAVAGSDLAGSCRIVDERGGDLLSVGVWTDASLGAAGIRSHASGVFERKAEIEFAERMASGSPVERRELAPESGKAFQLVPTSASRDPAGMFLGVDRGAMVSIVHAGPPPDGLGEFGMEVMARLRGGPGPSPNE